MFKVENGTKKITMNEGDFGVILPISFPNLLDGDGIKFIIKDRKEETEILSKDFTASSKKIDFVLTKEETAKLPIGGYYYDVQQYRKDELQNTLAVDRLFIVEEGV